MEIFILYKFYIFFILKSYFKKKSVPPNQNHRTHLRGTASRTPPSFSTDGRRGCRPDTGGVTRFPFRTAAATGHSSVSTTVSVTGDPPLNTSTLTPQGTTKNVLVPSLKYRMTYFSTTPNCVFMCIGTGKRPHSFLPDASR